MILILHSLKVVLHLLYHIVTGLLGLFRFLNPTKPEHLDAC